MSGFSEGAAWSRRSALLMANRALAPWLLGFLLLGACDRQPGGMGPSSGGTTAPAPALANSPVPPAGPRPAGAASDPGGSGLAPGGSGLARPGGVQARAEGSASSYRLPAAERLVAIGDLHGDLTATRQALQLGGAIDDQGQWVGGTLTVVQTGDQLDRGDQEQEILELLDRLAAAAAAHGGRVVVLNGNHETMNTLGDFRYVTSGALEQFRQLEPRSRFASSVPEPYRERAAAFLPGGAIALRLARRPIILQVGETVFVHGGIKPEHVHFGIDRLNREVAEFMRAERTSPPEPMVDPEGPLWTRVYGEPEPSAAACRMLDETLRMLDAQRLVVGHTVQKAGISSGCDGRVYRIDVGLAAHYGGSSIQVLELGPGGAKILTVPRRP